MKNQTDNELEKAVESSQIEGFEGPLFGVQVSGAKI